MDQRPPIPVPGLNLSSVGVEEQHSCGQKSQRSTGRQFQHLKSIGRQELQSSTKLKIVVAITYLLRTTKKAHYDQFGEQIVQKELNYEMLDKIAERYQLRSEVLEACVVHLAEDKLMKDELGPFLLGIVNYIDLRFNTTQIWDLKDPLLLLEKPYVAQLESECVKVAAASPRGLM